LLRHSSSCDPAHCERLRLQGPCREQPCRGPTHFSTLCGAAGVTNAAPVLAIASRWDTDTGSATPPASPTTAANARADAAGVMAPTLRMETGSLTGQEQDCPAAGCLSTTAHGPNHGTPVNRGGGARPPVAAGAPGAATVASDHLRLAPPITCPATAETLPPCGTRDGARG
jgi:hypothetical protein